MPTLKSDILRKRHLEHKGEHRLGHFISQYLFESAHPGKNFYEIRIKSEEKDDVLSALDILKEENDSCRYWSDVEIAKYLDKENIATKTALQMNWPAERGPWPPPICKLSDLWELIAPSDFLYIWNDQHALYDVTAMEIFERAPGGTHTVRLYNYHDYDPITNIITLIKDRNPTIPNIEIPVLTIITFANGITISVPVE